MDLNKIKNNSDNFYSKALFYLGWTIMGLGVLGSIILGSEYDGVMFFVGIFSTAISGFMILGLGEIINILNDNRRLLAAMTQNTDSSVGPNTASIADELPEI